jgi:hypothetical protein
LCSEQKIKKIHTKENEIRHCPLSIEGCSLSFNRWAITFNVLNQIAAHPIDHPRYKIFKGIPARSADLTYASGKHYIFGM